MGRLDAGGTSFAALVMFFLVAGCGGQENPPAPNVVATYSDVQITKEDLEDYLEKRTEGMKVLVGDSLVPLKDRVPKDPELYRGLIREMVLDDMVKRKIKEKQLDNRGNIRHALKHIEDELTLEQLHGEMHEKDRIPVSETEIQRYYDENRARFEDKPLYEVRDEIKGILASQKQVGYVEKYVSELKDAATITKNYELLRVPEPTEEEMRGAYEKNKEAYREPEKWVLAQIEISADNAKDRAERVWARLGGGESLEAIAGESGEDTSLKTIEYVKGSRGEVFDRAVTSLNPGEFTKPIQENGKYYVVSLKQKVAASFIPFDAVREEVRRSLMKKRGQELYEENRNRTLFTLHGRRFTLGDFYQEFQELPPAERQKHFSFEARGKLVDRMIERLLLLEDSYDRMLDAKTKEEVEHVREDILKQVFQQEEVDQKLQVTDEDVRALYDENKGRFRTPPRAKISLIVVRRGNDEASEKKARGKIDEAYEKLRSGLLKKGMSFEEVARLYSEDTQTAKNGGELDYWIGETNDLLSEMVDHPIHERIMRMKEGEISKPFAVGENYLIVKIREKDKPRQQSFEEVKDHLKEALKMKRHDELTAKMYGDMIEQADLVIYDQVLKTVINRQ